MYYLLLLFSILFPFIYNPFYHNNTFIKWVFLNGFILICWLVIDFQIIKGKNPFKAHKISKAEIYLLIFALLISISTLLSIDLNKSLIGEYGRYEGFTALISYISIFIFTYRFVPKEKIMSILKSMTIIATLVSIYGILQHFKLDPLPRYFTQLNATRSWGFFGNPNFFGSYLTLMLPFGMILFYISKSKINSILLLTSSGIIFLALLYSETRSGWLGSCIGYVILSAFLIFKYRSYWKKWIILSLTFLTIFIGVNFSSKQAVSNRIESTFTQVQQNVERGGSGRIYIWLRTIPLIDDYFLHGSGPDTLIDVYPNTEENLKNMSGAYVDKAHNEYLQMAVTLGTPALVIYLLFLFEVTRSSFKNLKNLNDKNKQITYALLASFIGYLIQAFFNISVITVAPLFWMIMGLLYKLTGLEKMIIN